MKKLLCVVFLLGLLFALAGCGGGDHPLVGRWELVSMEEIFEGESEVIEIDDFMAITFEFFADGTGVSENMFGDMAFTWSAERGQLTITERGDSEVVDYNISRSQLTLTFEDGDFTDIMTFRRAD